MSHWATQSGCSCGEAWAELSSCLPRSLRLVIMSLNSLKFSFSFPVWSNLLKAASTCQQECCHNFTLSAMHWTTVPGSCSDFCKPLEIPKIYEKLNYFCRFTNLLSRESGCNFNMTILEALSKNLPDLVIWVVLNFIISLWSYCNLLKTFLCKKAQT